MKRLVLVILLIVSICIFNAGCSRRDDNVITFATWGSKMEISIIKPIIEEYNKTHETEVKLIHIPQNYFHKIHLLYASNLAPDVVFVNNLYLPIYQKADLLEDLTEYINKNEYFNNALSTLSISDRVYAIPRDVSSFVVFYNKTSFKKALLKEPEQWSMKEFYETAKKLKATNEFGFCTELEPSSWENFVATENKPIILDGIVTIFEDKSLFALQELSDYINKEKTGVNKEQLALSPCAQLFINERAPIFISGRWSVPKLNAESKFDYGVAPFPQGNSKYYIPLNASGWAVSKKSKHKTKAIDFVKFLASDENMKKITKSGLITPAKINVAKSPEFKNGKVFVDIIEKSTPNKVPPDYNIIIDKLSIAADSVLGGYKTAREAFKDY